MQIATTKQLQLIAMPASVVARFNVC